MCKSCAKDLGIAVTASTLFGVSFPIESKIVYLNKLNFMIARMEGIR